MILLTQYVNAICSNVRLFADDTSLFIVVETLLAAAISLHADLFGLTRWAATWLVTFNATTKRISSDFTPSHQTLSSTPVYEKLSDI